MFSVCLMLRTGRSFYECQWTDPVTGRKKTQSTGTSVKREAERFRAQLEEKLSQGRGGRPVKIGWEQFIAEFRASQMEGLAKATIQWMDATIHHFEGIVQPAWPHAIGQAEVATFTDGVKARGLEAATLHGHMTKLRRILEWGVARKYIPVMPVIDIPEFSRSSKGRPISEGEMEAMADAIPKFTIVRNPLKWQFHLRGLWHSGLRLGESLALDWEDDSRLCVDFGSRRPVFRIRANIDKGRRDRIFPMAPEFADYLMTVPRSQRIGRVFTLHTKRSANPRQERLCKIIRGFGKRAGVAVGSRSPGKLIDGSDRDETIWAGAHDLRRSFGERWSWRVVPRVLQAMMRHSSIATTMTYYTSQDAQDIAEKVWEAFDGLGSPKPRLSGEAS